MHGLKANRSLGKRSCKRGLVNEDTWTKIIRAFFILNFFPFIERNFSSHVSVLKNMLKYENHL